MSADRRDTTLPKPPVAKTVPVTTEVHGERRVDDYHWLREKENPDVRAYLEAENAYTDAEMKPTEGFQQALYAEMLGRIQETDENVPYRRGDFYYYSRTEQGKQYPIYCRRKGRLEAEEEVTLDLNRLAEGRAFMSLGAYQVSDDASLLAYATDDTGFRQYTLFVKDLRTGALVEKVAEKVGSVAWAADDRTLFYTVEEDSTKRQYRLYRHRLGEGAHDLVLEEADPAFNVDVYRTRSRQYLVLGASSLTTSEVLFLPAAEPGGEWRLVAPRVHEQEYDLEHHGDVFYVRVNDTGRNFRLVKAPVASPGRESWTEVVPHRPEVMLEGVDCFRDHLVRFEREGGLPRVSVTDLRTGAAHRIAFPEAAYTVSPEANREFDTRTFRYGYQSLVTPPSVFDYDMETRTATLLKEQPVLGGYDRTQYETERVLATAPDGVAVPISIVYRKGLAKDGTAPLFLYAYGSYGFPLPITFSSNRVSLLDRGVVFALAHVRGGGEMGKAWHDDGRLARKRNTFTDFIAAAELLLAEKVRQPRPPGGRGRQRGRAPDGRGHQHAARPVEGCRLEGALRGRHQLDARRDAAPHRGRVRGVGQPEGEGGLRHHEVVLPLHQPRAEGLPGDPGEDLLQRQPGDVLGAGEVRGEAARAQDRREPAPAEDQPGRRARRGVGPLRLPARGGLRLRLHPRPDGDSRRLMTFPSRRMPSSIRSGPA